MKTATQGKTALKVSDFPEWRPEIDMFAFFDIIRDVNVLNKSIITEFNYSFTGQNKAVEKSVRKWIKTYAIGKVKYNPKTDTTHIMFKTGR